MDFDRLARYLASGVEGAGAAARDEARRVLDVLVERGDLSREEAQQLEAGVHEAVATQRRWLEERVLEPLGRTLRGASETVGLESRLAALEERLARIEALLAGRDASE